MKADETENSFPDAVPSRGGERISQKQHRPKLWDALRGRKNSKQIPFLGREWPGNSRTVHLLKQPEGVNCCPPGRGTKENCRHRKMVIRWCLRDIHPNPGPRGTDCDDWRFCDQNGTRTPGLSRKNRVCPMREAVRLASRTSNTYEENAQSSENR